MTHPVNFMDQLYERWL